MMTKSGADIEEHDAGSGVDADGALGRVTQRVLRLGCGGADHPNADEGEDRNLEAGYEAEEAIGKEATIRPQMGNRRLRSVWQDVPGRKHYHASNNKAHDGDDLDQSEPEFDLSTGSFGTLGRLCTAALLSGLSRHPRAQPLCFHLAFWQWKIVTITGDIVVTIRGAFSTGLVLVATCAHGSGYEVARENPGREEPIFDVLMWRFAQRAPRLLAEQHGNRQLRRPA